MHRRESRTSLRPHPRALSLVLVLIAALAFACDVDPNPGQNQADSFDDAVDPDTSSPDTSSPDTGGDVADTSGQQPVDPGTPVDPVTDPQAQEREELLERLADAKETTPEELLTRAELGLRPSVSHVPSDSTNLDLIQASSFALDSDALSTLDQKGFVIDGENSFPTFTYGYETLYAQDLPLYVSADSILYAVHRSYDKILQSVEQSVLIDSLRSMLVGMRTNLENGEVDVMGQEAVDDADLYLTVALSLLDGTTATPVAGADANEISTLLDLANEAAGQQELVFFGARRKMDFSQFEPRGHYTDTEELKRYFRAMMWLGRIDMRLIETQPDHSQVFHRRQFEAMVTLTALMGESENAHWQTLDRTIRAFVGESDNMTPLEVDPLLAELELTSLEQLDTVPDSEIAAAINAGGYGHQEISSHIMINGLDDGTMPLSSTFLLLGQRYVLDSHVFSNVVYDRTEQKRMMPDPLDVAYAALGNDQAASLLAGELTEYDYAGDLESMRVLADAHGDEFWDANLYNLWLTALRGLSPDAEEIADPAAAGLPELMTTEAWGRRILNTQLASWAELRHDTLLYAKQSYTAGTTCEFPDAYVDPYPKFYAALGQLALRGQQLTSELDFADAYLEERVQNYFVELYEVTSMLQEMAQYERDGVPFTDTHMAFINQAVRIHWGCGSPAGAEGWYARLFFNTSDSTDYDPTIADVHTQPTDEAGAPVGKVLHVATGNPRAMIVTVETCNGPRAYAGLVSSYHEVVTTGFDRMTDERWSEQLQQTGADDVSWMSDLVK